MTTRFIHTADWQVGKSFDRVSNPDKRARLRQERISVISRIGSVATETCAEFILVAGDLFDSPTSTRDTVAMALSAIGALPVPVIAIPGNHDHGGPAGLWEQEFFKRLQPELAPNFRILLEPAPIELETAWILPCPLLRRAETGDPTAWIRRPEAIENCGGGKPLIVLAHGSTQTFGSRDSDVEDDGETYAHNLIDLDRLETIGPDYCALGDWHGTRQIKPWAWYSGTPEPDRFARGNDHDPGNILRVEVDRGGVPGVRSIRTGGFGWHRVSFEFFGDDSLPQLESQIAGLIETRSGADLIQLDLAGALGLESATQLGGFLETLSARLLRLKLCNRTTLAPTSNEVEAMTRLSNDPLIHAVANRLLEESRQTDGVGETARIALRELYSLTRATTPDSVT